MAFVRLFGDRDFKARKLLSWGKEFQKDFHYHLAEDYYRKAYSYAQGIDAKKEALKAHLDSVDKQRRGPSDEQLRKHLNFLEDGDLLTYTSDINLLKLFINLRCNLTWSEEAKMSVLEDNEVDMNDTDNWLNAFMNSGEEKLSSINSMQP